MATRRLWDKVGLAVVGVAAAGVAIKYLLEAADEVEREHEQVAAAGVSAHVAQRPNSLLAKLQARQADAPLQPSTAPSLPATMHRAGGRLAAPLHEVLGADAEASLPRSTDPDGFFSSEGPELVEWDEEEDDDEEDDELRESVRVREEAKHQKQQAQTGDDADEAAPKRAVRFAMLPRPRPASPRSVSAVPAEERDGEVFVFSVATFNVLAESYCSNRQFPYTPVEVLDWRARRMELVERLEALDSDVLALQEVDHFEFFEPHLERLGYEYVYVQRPGEKKDGCVIAWRGKMFSRVSEVGVVDLNELALLRPAADKDRLGRNNIAVFCFLRPAAGQTQDVLVCNVHCYWNPLQEDLKLMQCAHVAKRLERAKAAHERESALMWCGDFNSLPQSVVHTFMVEGSSQLPTDDLEDFSAQRVLVDHDLTKMARWLRAVGIDAEQLDVHKAHAAEDIFERCFREKRLFVTRQRKLRQRKNSPPTYVVRNRSHKAAFQKMIVDLELQFDPERFYQRCTLCNGDIESLSVEDVQDLDDVPAKLRGGIDRTGFKLSFSRCVACQQVYWIAPKSQEALEQFREVFASAYRQKQAIVPPTHDDVIDAIDAIKRARPTLLPELDVVVSSPSKSRSPLVQARIERTSSHEAILVERDDELDEPTDFTDTDTDFDESTAAESSDADVSGLVARRDAVKLPASELAMMRSFSHDLNLVSAYAEFHGHEPQTTNVTAKFSGTLDYVFLSAPDFVVRRVPQLATRKEVLLMYGSPLPNEHWPSDHLAIRAEVGLLRRS